MEEENNQNSESVSSGEREGELMSEEAFEDDLELDGDIDNLPL